MSVRKETETMPRQRLETLGPDSQTKFRIFDARKTNSDRGDSDKGGVDLGNGVVKRGTDARVRKI